MKSSFWTKAQRKRYGRPITGLRLTENLRTNGMTVFSLAFNDLWALMAAKTGKPYCVIYDGLIDIYHIAAFDDKMAAKEWANRVMPDNGENWWVLLENGQVVDECS